MRLRLLACPNCQGMPSRWAHHWAITGKGKKLTEELMIELGGPESESATQERA